MPLRLRHAITMQTLLWLHAVSGCGTPVTIDEQQPRCQTAVVRGHVAVSRVVEMDVLLVIDDSASMDGEQAEVGAEVARVLRELPWLTEPDASLHVGVVSSDLGAGGDGSLSEGCTYPLGRDGRMLRAHTGGDPTCVASPSALPYIIGEVGESVDDIADRVGCLVQTGAGGCGFEPPLEAALKALTPAASALRFRQERGGVIESDTGGHGSGANAGFLREESLLLIVIITDEDDCSTADMDLFSPGGVNPQYPSPVAGPNADPGVQCTVHPSALHPVQRYVDGFLALRPGMEALTQLVVIGGVDPVLLAAHSTESSWNGYDYLDTDYDALLSEPGMQAVVDGSGESLVPACTRPAPDDPDNPAVRNVAAPARRLIAVAEGLGHAGVGSELVSVCSAVDAEAGDYRLDLGRLEAWWNLVRASDGQPSPVHGLPRPLERDANDRVGCRVTETLREGLRCEEVPGRTFTRLDDQREVCVVDQLSVPLEQRVPNVSIDGAGWYYDDFDTWLVREDQMIHFTPAGEPRAGSTYYLECVNQVCDEE